MTNINTDQSKIPFLMVILVILTLLGGCGSPTSTKIGDDSFIQLQNDVASVVNSSVADAAPLEIKFIKEKLKLAEAAKANRKRGLEAQLTEQIYANIKIARLRAEVNKKNNQLLNKRDQASAAQVYLSELKERLK